MAESKSNKSSKSVAENNNDAAEEKPAKTSRKNNRNQQQAERRAQEDKYEEIKQGLTHLSELPKMTVKELYETAKQEDISDCTGLTKQHLIDGVFQKGVQTFRVKC